MEQYRTAGDAGRRSPRPIETRRWLAIGGLMAAASGAVVGPAWAGPGASPPDFAWQQACRERLPPLRFSGNVAVTDDVYRTFLEATGCGCDDGSLVSRAPVIQACVRRFLRSSGYDLASVTASVAHDAIVLSIDEGVLHRIVIMGIGEFTTFRLKISVDLPGDVFNRPLLERRLAMLREAYNLGSTSFRLVPVAPSAQDDVQIADPGLFEGVPLIAPTRRYELHIQATGRGWTGKLRLSFGFDPPDGAFIRARARSNGLLADGDVARAESKAALRITEAFRSGTRLGLSRARLVLDYATPVLLSRFVRAVASADVGLVGRRREDLGVETFLHAPLQGTLRVQGTWDEVWALSLGAGLEQRFLFDVVTIEGETRSPIVNGTERDDRRFLLAADLDVLFGTDELRLDRDHRLNLSGRYYFPGTNRPSRLANFRLKYQKVFVLGWDELWLESHGALVVGDAPFYDEVSIGEGFLRTGFSGEFFSTRLASINGEFRVSVSRDVVKLSVFNDLAVFSLLDSQRDPQSVLLANALGIGLHVLILEAFQLNAYTGLALTSELSLDLGFTLNVQKAF